MFSVGCMAIPSVTKEYTEKKPSQMSLVKMLCLSMILVFPLTICGMSTSFPAVALPQMQLEMSHASSFGSVLQIAAPVGAILVGVIIDKYGRRSALLFSILPSIVGWLILYLNWSTTFTIVGQMLNGIMTGAVGYPSQVYAGECLMVNDVCLRNSFLSWIAISNAFGMFLVYVLGYFVNYRGIAAVASILSALSFALTYFCIPESPSWLYLQGRTGDAEWSEKKLGLCNPLLENAQAQAPAQQSSSLAADCDNLQLSPFHKMSARKLRRGDVWKPLLLGTILTVLLAFSGGMPVLTYMVQIIGPAPAVDAFNATGYNNGTGGAFSGIFSSNGTTTTTTTSNDTSSPQSNVTLTSLNLAPVTASNATRTNVTQTNHSSLTRAILPDASNLTNKTAAAAAAADSSPNATYTPYATTADKNTYGLSIISGALILVANVLMSLMLPHFGIKKILILPLLGMAVGMLVEALTVSYKSDPSIFVIHIGAVWFITFMYSYSLIIVPDTMLGDLFPVDAKGFASVPYLWEGVMTALVCKLHPYLHVMLGGSLFIFYSAVCLLSALFVHLFIPEIVGKTLQQINQAFL